MDASAAYLQTLIKQDSKLEEIFDEINKAIQKGEFNTTVHIYCVPSDEANDIVEILEKYKYKVDLTYRHFDTSSFDISWNL
jgi:hypothetical protein